MSVRPTAPTVSAPHRSGLPLFLLSLAGLTLLGWAGYTWVFLGFIENVMMPEAFRQFSLPVLAALFGAAAFFSPCAFTVLPAYVAHYVTGDNGAKQPAPLGQGRALARGLSFGLLAALGVIAVNLALGGVIALLGSAAPFAKDPRQDTALILGIRATAGLLIAVMGVLAVLDRALPLPPLPFRLRKPSFATSIFLYGVLYNGAAIGCTGPILLGLILYALTTGSAAGAFAVFAIFALTMGTLMVALTTAAALGRGWTAKKLVPVSLAVRKIAGAVMVVTGLTITALTLEGNRLFVKLFFPFLP